MKYLIGCILFISMGMGSDVAFSYQSNNTPINWDNLPGSYSVQNYTVQDGLPINSVNYISSSQAGYLYLATNDGLARFDGQSFKVYNTFNTPALRSNRIAWVGAFADELWLSDDQRNVYRLRDGEMLCMQDLEGMEQVEGYKIARYDDSTILLTTNAGFFKVKTSVFEFTRFEDPRTFVHFNNSFSFGRDSVYFIDDVGLHRIENEKVKLLYDANDFTIPLASIFNLVPGKSGEMWLLSDGGWLTKIEPNFKPVSFFLEENIEFRDAIEGSENTLLLSTNKGYFAFDQTRYQFNATEQISDSEPYFEDNAWNSGGEERITVFDNTIFINSQKVLTPDRPISYLMKDGEGSIWVATNGGGAYQILKNKLITLGKDVHPALENIYGLNEYSGTIWLAAFDNYMFSIRENNLRHWNAQTAGFTQPFFRTIEITGKGEVYAGNFDLWKKVGDSWEKTDYLGNQGLVNVLFEDSNQRLWIGTDVGLSVLERGNFRSFIDAVSTQIGSVQSITELADGTLLFATKDKGVAILSSSSVFDFINTEQGMSSNIVRDVMMTGSDTLWVATEDKGLNRVLLKQNRSVSEIKTLTTNDGLKDNSLHRLILDDYGFVWINSNRGIMRIPYKNMNAYLDGEAKLQVQYFSESDGLTNIEGNGGTQKAGFITSDGKLLLPNQGGLVYTRPEWHLESENSYPYPILIEEVRVADSILNYHQGSDIILPKGVRELSIDFTLPSFTAEEKLQFEYKLEDVNTDWVMVGNERSAIFSNLPSGTHNLQIRGQIQGLTSSSTIATAIVVPALFYETMLFAFLLIIGLIGAFFGLLKIAMAQSDKREEKLNSLVAERTEEAVREKEKTEQALQQLEELSESKSRFFTNFTHELRTPLTLILNPLDDIIQKKEVSIIDNNQSLLLVQRNAKRLKKLVNTLLDVSKLNSNELNIIFKPVRVVEITAQIAAQFEHELAKKSISFSIESKNNDAILYLDVNAWDHICTNLISNAIKFTDIGGSIHVQLVKQNNSVAISFQDTGMGIPESELAHIFDIYYQGDSQITRAGGTGIGLTLVKGFVEKMKGSITVTSTVGKGTRFEIIFPIGNAHLSEADVIEEETIEHIAAYEQVFQSPTVNESAIKKEKLRRIVLVEDNEDMREYISNVISSEYEVKTASNGKEGLTLIKSFSPELIVSDIMMPEMDGIEMMKHIRKVKGYEHIPFVFLTAKDSAADIQKGLNLGADVYLTKPVENNDLMLQIKVLLRRESKVMESGLENVEHPLVGQVTSVIARHLGNPDLSIELLAEALAMSESTLYRKWRKVSDVTINKTIAKLRFEEAMKLIQEEGLSISEAAFAVGFRHSSYFSSAFKKEYGVSPQEYFK